MGSWLANEPVFQDISGRRRVDPDAGAIVEEARYGPQSFEDFTVCRCCGNIGGIVVRRELGRLGAARILNSLQRDAHDAGIRHPKRACRTDREIDHAPAHERPTIIHATLNRAAVMRDRDHAAHWPRPMGAGHLAVMTTAAIVGRKACLGLCRAHRAEQAGCNQSESRQGKSPGVAAPRERGSQLRRCLD